MGGGGDRNANLHAAWDTDFVEHALGGKNEKLVGDIDASSRPD